MTSSARVHEKGTFSFSDLIADAKSKKDFRKAGAIATFIGVVRGASASGEKVVKLALEAYEEKADEALAKICDDLQKETGIVDVQIHHLLGEFDVGEDLVYVLVAGSHRREVFSVLERAVERYKKEAPIFKKEYVTTKQGEIQSRWLTEHEGAPTV
jgi:molybdopterin synthase catalytic subunit